MDAYEAIKAVLPRIQKLDPENSSRIMCSILMQDGGEKEIIRLAFVPEAVLVSYISQVKAALGLSSKIPNNGLHSSGSSSVIPNNGFHSVIPDNGLHLSGAKAVSKPVMIPYNGLHLQQQPVSYADVLSGGGSGRDGFSGYELFGGVDLGDEAMMRDVMVSASGRSDSLVLSYGENTNMNSSTNVNMNVPFHRRSFSVNDAVFMSDFEEGVGGGGGVGWRPCVYYARGFCKNGSSCKFIHSDIGESVEFGSSDSGFDEMLRLQQHKFGVMSPAGHHPFHYNKFSGSPRNGFSSMALRLGESSSLRQIYLTFPADSTFEDADVFRYFSKFGPVQDVRIPYQQKRMFGFVTFFFPETVKLILAKGNPHFVCNSRVLVKPYKEKGKVANRKQHQYMDRGESLACLSPSAIDSSELVDLPIGPRMLLNTQEMMRQKKLEEMELQYAIDLQGQRILNLQMIDRENPRVDNCFLPSMLSGFTSPNTTYGDVLQEFDDGREVVKSPSLMADDEKFYLEGIESSANNSIANAVSHNPKSYILESNFECTLPDNLFAAPAKSSADRQSIFSNASTGNTMNNTYANTATMPPSTSSATTPSSQSH